MAPTNIPLPLDLSNYNFSQAVWSRAETPTKMPDPSTPGVVKGKLQIEINFLDKNVKAADVRLLTEKEMELYWLKRQILSETSLGQYNLLVKKHPHTGSEYLKFGSNIQHWLGFGLENDTAEMLATDVLCLLTPERPELAQESKHYPNSVGKPLIRYSAKAAQERVRLNSLSRSRYQPWPQARHPLTIPPPDMSEELNRAVQIWECLRNTTALTYAYKKAESPEVDKETVTRSKLSKDSTRTLFADMNTDLILPFPGILPVNPTKRFDLVAPEPNDKFQLPRFRATGRRIFTRILEETEALRKPQESSSGLWMIGTEGYGKSHELAKLAIHLMLAGERVVYIPDCCACAASPVEYLKSALILAYAEEASDLKQILNITTKEEISKFVGSKKIHELYFVLDNYGALESVYDADIRHWLIQLTTRQIRVFCSSANHAAARQLLKYDNAGYNKLYLEGGYTGPEFERWWKRKEGWKLTSKKDELKILTGSVPLLLEEVARAGDFEDWKEVNQGDIAAAAREFAGRLKAAGNSTDFELYCDFTKCCTLRKRVSRIPFHLIDHRFFWVDSNRIGRCTNWVVADAMWRWTQHHRGSRSYNTDDFLGTIGLFANTPSACGFAVEAACISTIHSRGIPISNVPGLEPSTPLKIEYFAEKFPNMLKERHGTILYVPDSCSYPNIDAIVCARSTSKKAKEVRQVTLLPLQITLNPATHSDSEQGFFETFSEMSSNFPPSKFKVSVQFIWIGGTEPGEETLEANSLGYDHPKFVRITLPFETLNADLATTLARHSVTTGTKRLSRTVKLKVRTETTDSDGKKPSKRRRS